MQLARWAIFGSFVGIFMRIITPGHQIDTTMGIMMVGLFLLLGLVDQMNANPLKKSI